MLSSFAAQIAAIEAGRKEPELRVGDLSKARDFLDVRDVVEAYRALIAKAPDMADRVGVFNIASGEPHTMATCSIASARARGDRSKHASRPSFCGPGVDLPSIACDAAKLRAITGWRRRWTVDDMCNPCSTIGARR